MSEERSVQDPSGQGEMTMTAAVALDPAETQRLRAEKKARLARILDRGMVADRLSVELPPDKHGEWIPNDKSEIYRMQTLGFWVDKEYATKRALHDQGDGASVVGDAIFMVCEKENKEILDEIRRENYEAINGKPGTVRGSQREEKDAAANLRKIGMPVVEESRERQARKQELAAVLKANQEGTGVSAAGGAPITPAGEASAVPQPHSKIGNIIR